MKNKGLVFEETLAKAWVSSNIPLVRMKITETGEEKPCDERVDFGNFRVFNELKSTKNKGFKITEVKSHQMRALYNWHKKFDNTIGLVSIEFRSNNVMFFVDIVTFLNLGRQHSRLTPNLLDTVLSFKVEKINNAYNIDISFLEYLNQIAIGRGDIIL